MEQATEALAVGGRQKAVSSWRKSVRPLPLYVVSIALSVMFFFPYFYTLTSSFKGPWEMFNWPPTVFPERLRWTNYVDTVTMVPFGRWIYNTVVITFLSTLGVVITSSVAATGC